MMEGRTLGTMMIRSLLFAHLLLSGLPTQAGANQPSASITRIAANPSGQRMESWKVDALKPFVIGVSEPQACNVRNITVTMDRMTVLAELPMLQEHGALSRSIAREDMEKRPAYYANVLSLLLTSYAVRDLYATHPDLGATRWKVSLSPPSDGDGQAVREMFSFRFDRPRFQSVEWDRLAFTEFPKVAAGFSYNLRFTLEMSHELDGSIADD